MLTAILSKLGLKRSLENPAIPLSAREVTRYLQGTETTPSGERVTVDRALSYSPVWGGTDMISSDVSRLPLIVFQRDGRNRQRAKEHPAYRLLRRHTGEVTANIWLCRMISQALIYGNGYSRILRDSGRPMMLQWLHADRVEPMKEDGMIYYLVKYRGQEDRRERVERVMQRDMFHLMGLTLTELGGLSMIGYARNTIGRQLAAEGYGDDFFANMGQPSGFFEHPAQMSDSAKDTFIREVARAHTGAGKRFKAAVLEEGMKWTSTDVNPEDALLIEQLGWGVKDVARFLSIPPHRLGDDTKSSFASLEQENLSYIQTTLGKWINRIECEATEKLLTDDEKAADSHYVEFEQNAIAKADMSTRHNSYALAIQWGWMSRNEVRERENLNPYDGGDEYLTPLNMTTEQEGESDQDETMEQDRSALLDSPELAMAELEHSLTFGVRMIVNKAHQHATRGADKFWQWLQGFQAEYQGKLEAMVRSAVTLAEVRKELVSDVLKQCEDAFLAAAECQPEELTEKIDETLAPLYGACHHLVRQVYDADRVSQN